MSIEKPNLTNFRKINDLEYKNKDVRRVRLKPNRHWHCFFGIVKEEKECWICFPPVIKEDANELLVFFDKKYNSLVLDNCGIKGETINGFINAPLYFDNLKKVYDNFEIINVSAYSKPKLDIN